MEIEVLSIYHVQKMLKCRDRRIADCNWISISDGYDVSSLPDGENILKLNFDDVTTRDNFEMELFNEDHAAQIIAFADRLTIPQLLIHCYAGVSRSGAVSKVLNIYLNLLIGVNHRHFAAFINKYDRVIRPNPLVERLLWLQIGETLARKNSRNRHT